jgi:D-alanyl-D-alanine carboxypeptidase-like protein
MRHHDHQIRRTLWRRVRLALAVMSSSFAAVSYGTAQPSAGTGSILPISAAFCEDMRVHHVLNGGKVGCDRLRMVKFSYFGFDGKIHDNGEIVVMDAAAPHVLRIFERLRKMRFPVAKARPLNGYEGDDNASMRDNNSSGFNDRAMTGGGNISLHAYGLAIDLNPVQNPYLSRTGDGLKVDPPAGSDYINRLDDRPGKRPRPGMAEAVVRVFANEGFLTWGGYWDDPIDYQHFQVSRKLAEQLAAASPAEAARKFDAVVDRFRKCQQKYPAKAMPNPRCLEQADKSN